MVMRQMAVVEALDTVEVEAPVQVEGGREGETVEMGQMVEVTRDPIILVEREPAQMSLKCLVLSLFSRE